MEPELERYSRQMALPQVGAAGQRRLLESRAVLVGCGATGSVIARTLVGAGVGHLRLIDRDCVEESNLQRQILYDEDDVRQGLPKAVAARAKLARVNSQVDLEAAVSDVTSANCRALLEGADVLLDGTDNLETRFLLNEYAVRHGKPWVYCGAVATFGHVMVVVPGASACFACYLPQPPAAGEVPGCDTAGVAGPAVAVAASCASMAALRVLLGQAGPLAGMMTLLDVWAGSWDQVRVERRPGCPVCEKGCFAYLEGRAESRAAALCGREAVQLSPPTPGGPVPAFAELAGRLSALGSVSYNEYVLRFAVGGVELSLFSDGRAIVKGTSDPVLARSLFARYIGS